MGTGKEKLKTEKLQDDMRRDIRHVAINDNVYFISEQDCLEYDNCNSNDGNDLNIWCDKMIKKYKPKFFLDIIVHRDIFNSLEKGLEIQVTERNPKKFIIDFKVLTHKDKESEDKVALNHPNVNNVNSKQLSSLPSSHSLGVSVLEREGMVSITPLSKPSVQDNIRYAQCVNIAFENFNLKHTELMFQPDGKSAMILELFDLADKIYIEFNKRCSR